MSEIIEFLIRPDVQAVFWTLCVIFAFYYANFVKRMSFGDDTGTKAWLYIAIGLFAIGLRVSFKVVFPDYSSSYDLQVLRFSLGIIGTIILTLGVVSYYSALRRMYGVID